MKTRIVPPPISGRENEHNNAKDIRSTPDSRDANGPGKHKNTELIDKPRQRVEIHRRPHVPKNGFIVPAINVGTAGISARVQVWRDGRDGVRAANWLHFCTDWRLPAAILQA